MIHVAQCDGEIKAIINSYTSARESLARDSVSARFWMLEVRKANSLRDLLYNAAKHFKHGKALAEQGDYKQALTAYREALRDLHAVRPQRMRDVLLAQVYLSRYQAALECDSDSQLALSDLRMGYSYARTTQEPHVRQAAEDLWQAYLEGVSKPLVNT